MPDTHQEGHDPYLQEPRPLFKQKRKSNIERYAKDHMEEGTFGLRALTKEVLLHCNVIRKKRHEYEYNDAYQTKYQ